MERQAHTHFHTLSKAETYTKRGEKTMSYYLRENNSAKQAHSQANVRNEAILSNRLSRERFAWCFSNSRGKKKQLLFPFSFFFPSSEPLIPEEHG